MNLPHVVESAYESVGSDSFSAIPFWRFERVNLSDCAFDLVDAGFHAGCQTVEIVRIRDLCILKFHRLDVLPLYLRIDHQHAPPRVAFRLCRKKGSGKLPLAGTGPRIVTGVVR